MLVKLHSNVIHWIRLRGGVFVLFPHFNSFIAFASQESNARLVKSSTEDAAFSGNGTRLNLALKILEIVTGFPVPEAQLPIVTACNQHILSVDSHAVENLFLSSDIAHKFAFRTLPDFDIVSTSTGKCIFFRMNSERTDGFFMVGQCFNGFPHSQIPASDCIIM